MKIAVIGSGPAGSSAALFLAEKNHEVVLLDPKGPNEKTCGGGVPAKCLQRFSTLYSDFKPAELRHENLIFAFNGKDTCEITMPGGMGIFSRKEHDNHIFNKALSAGVQYKQETFKSCETDNEGWLVKTDISEFSVDFLVGADGAVSRVRNQLLGKMPKESYFKASDYLLSRTNLPLHIGFDSSLNGYLWVFPRKENCSIGIVDFGDDKSHRMKLLDDYMKKFSINESDIIKKRSALIPSLRKADLKNHRIADNNWALVGDAAALAEPITGEGIYYAVYSSWLLSECIESGRNYNEEWKKEFSRIIGEAKVARRSYRYMNHGFMKFLLRRSSLMRSMTGEYMAAFKHGKVYRMKFFLSLPLVVLQSLISKPVEVN